MVDCKQTKRKPQTRALAFRLVFVDIRFLLVSLKHEKFHIPVKLYFKVFQKAVSILIISCKFNFSSSHAMYKTGCLLLTFNICILFPDWIQLPYLVCWHALEFSTWLDSSGCVELLQRFQLEINSLNRKKKDDQTNLDKEGAFQRWNVFCLLQLTFKCNGVFWFGLYRKYKEEPEGFHPRRPRGG